MRARPTGLRLDLRLDLRLGLRARLTLIYGSLFLITGGLLVGMTYLLSARAVNARFRVLVSMKETLDPAVAPFGPLPLPGTQETTEPGVDGQMAKRPGIAVKSIFMDEMTDQRRELLQQLLQASLLTMIALGVLAVVLGYLVAGRSLRPLQTVTATARRLSESTLHERIGLTGPRDEIKELADTFDSMLDRLHRAFDSQRRFIANASHELRTPLAINRAVIEVALGKPDAPEETKALAGKLLRTTGRHERLIDGLLLLARSERELRDRSAVDLREIAAGVLDQLSETATEADVTMLPSLSAAETTGDAVLLERCIANLAENAIKYNVPGGQVRISTGTLPGGAFVQVENTGPPVHPDQIPAIFEPFGRLRSDRVGSARGSGLGLSIVRAVCAAHGGSIRTYARPAGGLLITVDLPSRYLPSQKGALPPMSSAKPCRLPEEEHAGAGR